MTTAFHTALTWWNIHRDHITLISFPLIAGITLILALITALKLRKSYKEARNDKREATWISNYVTAVILIISADGMWRLLYMHMHIPPIVAIPVCFVAEGTMVALMALAAHRNADTQYNSPGPYAVGVWITAESFGLVVALNSTSALEFMLRLMIPNAAAMLWHLQLIAKNQKRPDAITWIWTPRNLAAQLGIIAPGDHSLADRKADRAAKKLAELAFAYQMATTTKDVSKAEAKLRRFTLTADDEVVAKAEAALRRVFTITDRTARARLSTPAVNLEICAAPETTPEPAAPAPAAEKPARALEIKTPTIPPVLAKTNGHTPDLRVPVVAASISRPAASGASVGARREADLAIVNRHRDELIRLHQDDNLNRTPVERLCGVNRRQADRIIGYVTVMIANIDG